MSEDKKPVSKYVKSIINAESFLWLNLFPTVDVLKKINQIQILLDKETFGRTLFHDENTPKEYSDYAPYSLHLRDGNDDAFAICIAKKDSIDFIVLKKMKSFEECFDLCRKEFEIF